MNITRPVEGPGVGWGQQPPRFLLKLTFYQLKMMVKRKKVTKKYKPLEIPRKLLGNITIVHFM